MNSIKSPTFEELVNLTIKLTDRLELADEIISLLCSNYDWADKLDEDSANLIKEYLNDD